MHTSGQAKVQRNVIQIRHATTQDLPIIRRVPGHPTWIRHDVLKQNLAALTNYAVIQSALTVNPPQWTDSCLGNGFAGCLDKLTFIKPQRQRDHAL